MTRRRGTARGQVASRAADASFAPPGPTGVAWRLRLATLVVFAAVFGSLAGHTARVKSATWDEPIHLAHGYASLTRGDYRLDPEHPPLVRLWAALPLLGMPSLTLDTSFVDRSRPADYARQVLPVPQQFLYFDNDGDRLLVRARLMIVLLGIALGALLFSWAYEWLGYWPAVLALALYSVEPNLLAHSAVVTTDMGLTVFMFGAIYALWRAHRDSRLRHLAAVAGFVTLAIASKYSALLLGPIVIVLLAVPAWRGSMSLRTALVLVAALALTSWAGLWASYGFRYAPSRATNWTYNFQNDPDVVALAPGAARAQRWIDRYGLLPNAYSEGLLFSQAKAEVRPAFLMGEYSDTGWWYYFPVAFLIKTPIALLVWLTIGLAALVLRRGPPDRRTWAYVLVPPAIYVGVAMTGNINIGLRHILPAYPFVLLAGAAGTRVLLDRYGARARYGLIALAAIGCLELAGVYPHTLAFFNRVVGGPSNGGQYLVDSNLDWGQDLKGLKRWMDAEGVSHVNLAYFGSAHPGYYRISRTDMPGSIFFVPDKAELPRLPGYVAVSATILSGVYGEAAERQFYEGLRRQTPRTTIGHSIHIYWVNRPWW